MRADIWLGVITIFMTVLGGIVSAHAPTKSWQKIGYVAAFVLAGGASVWLIIRISNENAATSKGLTDALEKLTDSTREISRVTELNTDLQNRLLLATNTVAELAKENLKQATGATAYCYLLPNTLDIPNQATENQFSLAVTDPTDYPLYGVTVDIGFPDRAMLHFSLGDIPPRIPKITTFTIPFRKDRDNRNMIQICSTRTTCFRETMVTSWNNGKWNEDYEISRIEKSGRMTALHKIANCVGSA